MIGLGGEKAYRWLNTRGKPTTFQWVSDEKWEKLFVAKVMSKSLQTILKALI